MIRRLIDFKEKLLGFINTGECDYASATITLPDGSTVDTTDHLFRVLEEGTHVLVYDNKKGFVLQETGTLGLSDRALEKLRSEGIINKP